MLAPPSPDLRFVRGGVLEGAPGQRRLRLPARMHGNAAPRERDGLFVAGHRSILWPQLNYKSLRSWEPQMLIAVRAISNRAVPARAPPPKDVFIPAIARRERPSLIRAANADFIGHYFTRRSRRRTTVRCRGPRWSCSPPVTLGDAVGNPLLDLDADERYTLIAQRDGPGELALCAKQVDPRPARARQPAGFFHGDQG